VQDRGVREREKKGKGDRKGEDRSFMFGRQAEEVTEQRIGAPILKRQS
jgi:hypothetical protein